MRQLMGYCESSPLFAAFGIYEDDPIALVAISE
jgi:hypothetical protein